MATPKKHTVHGEGRPKIAPNIPSKTSIGASPRVSSQRIWSNCSLVIFAQSWDSPVEGVSTTLCLQPTVSSRVCNRLRAPNGVNDSRGLDPVARATRLASILDMCAPAIVARGLARARFCTEVQNYTSSEARHLPPWSYCGEGNNWPRIVKHTTSSDLIPSYWFRGFEIMLRSQQGSCGVYLEAFDEDELGRFIQQLKAAFDRLALFRPPDRRVSGIDGLARACLPYYVSWDPFGPFESTAAFNKRQIPSLRALKIHTRPLRTEISHPTTYWSMNTAVVRLAGYVRWQKIIRGVFPNIEHDVWVESQWGMCWGPA
ncbi:hypothetical protein DACRYDRAFT_13005 [Dacryopinax primogenitus]|uniref:Uncharacterized protein n=1 Tax=Dacryopinax primogenitus (strain DJM 731) TaxID=1858805 RepID=M5GBG7_DACPD|nr:uncharacterized protein DACRYDRAFT_13005 [Dacryopinax primogenitus]EJU06299.1 hypothetical protein DACRYDRAFT_13005 [Dacryopinax primogenitus]